MECHTEHNMGVPVLKENALFGGNNAFATADIGLPPAYGATIYSANITQDATGIKGWVAADVVQVLSTGTDKMGRALCPPMPFGPMGAFGGLTARTSSISATTSPPSRPSPTRDSVLHRSVPHAGT